MPGSPSTSTPMDTTMETPEETVPEKEQNVEIEQESNSNPTPMDTAPDAPPDKPSTSNPDLEKTEPSGTNGSIPSKPATATTTTTETASANNGASLVDAPAPAPESTTTPAPTPSPAPAAADSAAAPTAQSNPQPSASESTQQSKPQAITPSTAAAQQPTQAPEPASTPTPAPEPASTSTPVQTTTPTMPASGMVPPTLPALPRTTPTPASATPRGPGRPPLVGQPAAKRARVNGTLDAGMMYQMPAGDMSESVVSRYQECSREVGIRLISTPPETPKTGNPKDDFVADHLRFMKELNTEFKIRTIGGSKLDLFTLYKSVLERGGVQNVISSRTFRLVAKALNLPKSCTSAAYILRSDYERLLYAYEQNHVWGRDPSQLPILHATEKVRGPAATTSAPSRSAPRPRVAANSTPTPAHLQMTPTTIAGSARPKRQAALAASNAVAAAAAGLDDDDDASPPNSPRRTRTAGLDESALTLRQEAMAEEETNTAAHAVYIHGTPAERERVTQALWSAEHDDVAFALGTLNALSYDPRNTFVLRQFPGILEALCEIMTRHLEDVNMSRKWGAPLSEELTDANAPRVSFMSAANILDAGTGATSSGVQHRFGDANKGSSLQQYGSLFNLVDSIAVDREQCAVVAVNVLRNASFDDRNALFLATSNSVLDLSAEMLLNMRVPANLRDGLIDVWINVSPYLNVSKGYPGHIVLKTCIKMLDFHLEGADFNRFTNCGEILARLAASPERNEEAFVAQFNELLPRLVDLISGKDRRFVNAGLAAICNCSSFDWPARSRIARERRCMPRLVNMLADHEHAPRAALTILNLAEAPSNRTIILAYEKQLVEQAIKVSPASETVASILFDLNID